MTKKQNQTKEEALVNKLSDLADRTEPENADTAQGFVYRNLDLIKESKAKGYRWEDLAKMLTEGGYKIKGSTLAYYYREARKNRDTEEKKTKAKTRKTAQAKKRAEELKREEERRNVMG